MRPSRDEVTDWAFDVSVRISSAYRRAIARKLGKPGLASRQDIQEITMDLLTAWVGDAMAEATAGARQAELRAPDRRTLTHPRPRS